ncbi:MAG: urease accessory UreF family protein [Xenococcaceae cyanobacterium MO_188.B32]|nr:urease accessory UreF family protein [Xenococcaceae cyanobacterium MO_188.B32]
MNQSSSIISRKLALMQLADSFFPSGSFTLSHGLESLVQTQQLRSPQDLVIFLQLLLRHKVGTSDVVALIHAYRRSAKNDLEAVRQVDNILFAQTVIAKIRETQRKSGRALLMVANSTWQDEQLQILARDAATGKIHCLHPVIFAVVARAADLAEEDTAIAFLHNFVTSLLGAAIRLSILGHRQAQQLLLKLAPEIAKTYHTAKSMSLEEMYSCTPSIDIAQMQHRKLSSRLFAS